MRFAPQLPHRLDDLRHSAAIGRVVVAQAAAVGVERKLADTRDQVAVGDECAAFALFAKSEIFELDQNGDGEAVIDGSIFDVGRRDAGLGERERAGACRRGGRQVDASSHRMLDGFARAAKLYARTPQGSGDIGMRDDDGAAAVRHHAAIQLVQRRGDHRRGEHLFHGDDIGQHRMRVVLRVMRGRDLDPGKLFRGGAEFVHVPHGAHGVEIADHRTVGMLERHVRRVVRENMRDGADGGRLRTRASGQCHQGDPAFAHRDGFRRVRDMKQIGRAAGIGRIHMPDIEAEIIQHRQRPEAIGVARTKIAVDVIPGQTGSLEGAPGDFRVKLPERFVGRLAGGVLVSADDIGCAVDAHAVSAGAVRRYWEASAAMTLLITGQ